MRSHGHLRRWPRRNFLAELEPDLRDTHAIDDLARRDPRLRRLQAGVRVTSRSIRSRVKPDAWIEFADLLAAARTMEFEIAFNLGFENGLVRGRVEAAGKGRHRKRTVEERGFEGEIRRLIAGSEIASNRLLALLAELCAALAAGEPRITKARRGRRDRSHR